MQSLTYPFLKNESIFIKQLLGSYSFNPTHIQCLLDECYDPQNCLIKLFINAKKQVDQLAFQEILRHCMIFPQRVTYVLQNYIIVHFIENNHPTLNLMKQILEEYQKSCDWAFILRECPYNTDLFKILVNGEINLNLTESFILFKRIFHQCKKKFFTSELKLFLSNPHIQKNFDEIQTFLLSKNSVQYSDHSKSVAIGVILTDFRMNNKYHCAIASIYGEIEILVDSLNRMDLDESMFI